MSYGAAQVRQWSEEVARDPRSLSFIPLAEAYRLSGRGDAALRLCLRGLEHHPDNVEAHYLLGVIYRSANELDNAFDEWDIALRLDAAHLRARREIGLLCLERGDRAAAIRHLEHAAALDPADAVVRAALHEARGETQERIPVPGIVQPAEEQHGGRGGDLAELIAALQAPIARFVRAAQPQLVLLIDSRGKLLGHHGFPRALDPIAIASLGAGIHASARALAQLLRQDRFDHLYQRGSRGQIFFGPFATPAEELILIAVLQDESLLGLVRLAFGRFEREVAQLPEWKRPRVAATAESFEQDLEAGWHQLFGRR